MRQEDLAVAARPKGSHGHGRDPPRWHRIARRSSSSAVRSSSDPAARQRCPQNRIGTPVAGYAPRVHIVDDSDTKFWLPRIHGQCVTSLHSLRHSHVMHYVVDRGLPLPIVQKQVGHRSLKTTSVYLSASTEKMAQAYKQARMDDKRPTTA